VVGGREELPRGTHEGPKAGGWRPEGRRDGPGAHVVAAGGLAGQRGAGAEVDRDLAVLEVTEEVLLLVVLVSGEEYGGDWLNEKLYRDRGSESVCRCAVLW